MLDHLSSPDGRVPRQLGTSLVKRSLLDQLVGGAFVIVPIAGTLALVIFWSRLAPTAVDMLIAVALYALTGIGVTAGYHRLAAHKSFEVSNFVKMCLLALGSMAFQGPVARWVADHRRHHAFTDVEGDPHTPFEKGGLSGLAWSHFGWLFSRSRTRVSKFAPDVLKDRVVLEASKRYMLLSLLSLVIPALLGFALRPNLAGFLTGFLLGGCARICLFQNATWAVNSLAHFAGQRPHATGDRSTNNWLVAMLTLGEGWHNNHHAAPRSARHGSPGQLDMTYVFICGMRRIGFARNIRGSDFDQAR